MKQSPFLTVALAVLIIGLQFCKKNSLRGNQDEPPAARAGITPTGQDNDNAAVQSCVTCKDYKGLTITGLKAPLAKSMAGSYQSINRPLLTQVNGYNDANSIWFSVETLKNFLWQIEAAICANRCSGSVNAGVRIYYARYPDAAQMAGENNLSALPPSYANCHTLFMVPTFQDQTLPQVQHDFDPWHWGTSSGCVPKTMQAWFAGSPQPFAGDPSLILSSATPQSFSTTPNNWISIQNHGSMVPPDPITGSAF